MERSNTDEDEVASPPAPNLRESKLRLVESARRIDPLAPLRKHPLLTVGVAAGAGWCAGANVAFKLSHLTRFITLLHPLAMKGAQMAASYFVNHRQSPSTEGTTADSAADELG